MAEAASERMTEGSPFWRFSVAFYGRPGVAQACLDLQDCCGVDVNLVLFLLWMATSRRRLASEAVRALDARASDWRSAVVEPLRELRRRLKGGAPLVDAATAAAFRDRVKALELEAERLQQEGLYAMMDGLAVEEAASAEAAARANVSAYERVQGRAFDPSSVDVLIAAIACGDAGSKRGLLAG
jgi:uncharacterized protein (TIGR02444 family)